MDAEAQRELLQLLRSARPDVVHHFDTGAAHVETCAANGFRAALVLALLRAGTVKTAHLEQHDKGDDAATTTALWHLLQKCAVARSDASPPPSGAWSMFVVDVLARWGSEVQSELNVEECGDAALRLLAVKPRRGSGAGGSTARLRIVLDHSELPLRWAYNDGYGLCGIIAGVEVSKAVTEVIVQSPRDPARRVAVRLPPTLPEVASTLGLAVGAAVLIRDPILVVCPAVLVWYIEVDDWQDFAVIRGDNCERWVTAAVAAAALLRQTLQPLVSRFDVSRLAAHALHCLGDVLRPTLALDVSAAASMLPTQHAHVVQGDAPGSPHAVMTALLVNCTQSAASARQYSAAKIFAACVLFLDPSHPKAVSRMQSAEVSAASIVDAIVSSGGDGPRGASCVSDEWAWPWFGLPDDDGATDGVVGLSEGDASRALATAMRLKDEGNACFKRQQYRAACSCYLNGLRALSRAPSVGVRACVEACATALGQSRLLQEAVTAELLRGVLTPTRDGVARIKVHLHHGDPSAMEFHGPETQAFDGPAVQGTSWALLRGGTSVSRLRRAGSLPPTCFVSTAARVGNAAGKGRGLFATRDIEPGEVLLCEPCVVASQHDATNSSIVATLLGGDPLPAATAAQLTEMQRVWCHAFCAASIGAVYTLVDGGTDDDVAGPRSDGPPTVQSADGLSGWGAPLHRPPLDATRLVGISQLNDFEVDGHDGNHDVGGGHGGDATGAVDGARVAGTFPWAAMLNHDDAPNCHRVFLWSPHAVRPPQIKSRPGLSITDDDAEIRSLPGPCLVSVAAVAVRNGDELTHRYGIALDMPGATRRAARASWRIPTAAAGGHGEDEMEETCWRFVHEVMPGAASPLEAAALVNSFIASKGPSLSVPLRGHVMQRLAVHVLTKEPEAPQSEAVALQAVTTVTQVFRIAPDALLLDAVEHCEGARLKEHFKWLW